MLLEYQQEMPLNLLQRILILLVNYYFQDLNKKYYIILIQIQIL